MLRFAIVLRLTIKNNIKLNLLTTLFLKEQDEFILPESNTECEIQPMLYLNTKIKEVWYFNYSSEDESSCQLYISTDKASIITLSMKTLISSLEITLQHPNTK